MFTAPNSDIFLIWDVKTIQLFYSRPSGLCNKELVHSSPPMGFTPISFALEKFVAPYVASQITGAQNPDGKLEIFYTDSQGVIYHNWQDADGAWNHHGYLESPTTTAKRMAIAQNLDGTLELFYVGGDGTLYHNSQAVPDSAVAPGGAWNGGVALGSVPVAAVEIAVAPNSDGRLELFYTTPAGVLYHDWQVTPGGSWNGPALLLSASDKAKKVAVILDVNDFIDLFYIGADGTLRHSRQNPDHSWSAPVAFGPNSVIAKDLSVVRNTYSLPGDPQNVVQTLEIFYVGGDDVLYHDWQLKETANSWNGRKTVYSSNDKASRLSTARLPGGRLELLFVDLSNNLSCTWQGFAGAETWVPPQSP